MTRDYHDHEHRKMVTLRRERALQRREIRGPGESRQSAASPTSLAVKTVDPYIRRMIDAALDDREK